MKAAKDLIFGNVTLSAGTELTLAPEELKKTYLEAPYCLTHIREHADDYLFILVGGELKLCGPTEWEL